jgi:hypothetical protein
LLAQGFRAALRCALIGANTTLIATAMLPVVPRQMLLAFANISANRGDSILLPCAASMLREVLRVMLRGLIPNHCATHEHHHDSR